MTREELIRHLHVLIAYCHLELARVRSMSPEEWDLVRDIAKFMESR